MNKTIIDIKERQEPLRKHYKTAPGEAMITDRAATTGEHLNDSLHGRVRPGDHDYGIVWSYGIHKAVGGFHDLPNPGDMLNAALATCMDSTIRMIANRLQVTLTKLVVEVCADVDVRGTLVVDPKVPVGFQKMQIRVDIAAVPGTDPKLIQKLLNASEHSCVNLQTLKQGVPVKTDFHIENDRP